MGIGESFPFSAAILLAAVTDVFQAQVFYTQFFYPAYYNEDADSGGTLLIFFR